MSEFQDVVKLIYEWEVPDTPSFFCLLGHFQCGSRYDMQMWLICHPRHGHDKFRELQAELLSMVSKDV